MCSSRSALHCTGSIYIHWYGFYQPATGTPRVQGDEGWCSFTTAANTLLTRMFQWIGIAWDPSRAEMRVYVHTPFSTFEQVGRCGPTTMDPGVARTIQISGSSAAQNPIAQITYAAWFDRFLT